MLFYACLKLYLIIVLLVIAEPLLKLMQIMRGLEFERTLHHRRTDGLISGYAQDG